MSRLLLPGTSYGDAVRELDASIGRILKLVREVGITNRTLIIFTSDNGAALVSRQHGEMQSIK